jgi:toxin ParE1/3/4
LDIVWLPTGRRTRVAQIDYIAGDNPSAAARIDEDLGRQVRQLRDHPLIGRPGRAAGTRELVISRTPFIVIYRITDRRIEMLRVLHGAQQWPSRSR